MIQFARNFNHHRNDPLRPSERRDVTIFRCNDNWLNNVWIVLVDRFDSERIISQAKSCIVVGFLDANTDPATRYIFWVLTEWYQ